MKTIKLIAGLMFLTTFSLYAQETLSFEKVIKTDSVGKQIIFVTINDWVATTYNSANDVVQMSDKDAGIIIGKGLFNYHSKNRSIFSFNFDGNIKYTIKIYVKDNRYKVILTDFNHSANTNYSYSFGVITTKEVYKDEGKDKKSVNQNWNDAKLRCKQYSNDIFSSLENKTKKMKVETSGDDW